ncbi:MAG: hypothetical protein GF311_09865, partial [Candidatus Lokiarchaeota archaeon]|nr:hypothetical protein [Candidatus Lokiarchaeota archaeon]
FLHLSDLHYGSKEFSLECMENIIDYVNSKKNTLDMVFIKGDLTEKGKFEQFDKIKGFISQMDIDKLVVVGNHDAKYNYILNFEKFFGTRITRKFLMEHNLLALGLRSAKDDLKLGDLGEYQLKYIVQQFLNFPDSRKNLSAPSSFKSCS